MVLVCIATPLYLLRGIMPLTIAASKFSLTNCFRNAIVVIVSMEQFTSNSGSNGATSRSHIEFRCRHLYESRPPAFWPRQGRQQVVISGWVPSMARPVSDDCLVHHTLVWVGGYVFLQFALPHMITLFGLKAAPVSSVHELHYWSLWGLVYKVQACKLRMDKSCEESITVSLENPFTCGDLRGNNEPGFRCFGAACSPKKLERNKKSFLSSHVLMCLGGACVLTFSRGPDSYPYLAQRMTPQSGIVMPFLGAL